MPQTMPWGAQYTLLCEFQEPTNLFTLNDATLGVLGGTGFLDGKSEDDITDRVLAIEISRGRHDQFQDFQAGTMTLTLSNNDRFLDPVNTVSPFFNPSLDSSGVTIRRKVSLKYENTTIFSGRITDIDISYDPTSAPNTRSTVSIEVADNFVLLSNQYLEEFLPSTQLSGARVNAILALPEVAYSEPISVSSGTIVCLDDPIADQTRAIDAIQAVAATERGYFFIEGDGTLRFTSRLTGSATPTVQFADNGTGIEYESLSIVYGQENLYNRIVCTPIDSVSPSVAQDVASQTTYGISALSVSGLLCSDIDAQTLADYLLELYKNPSYRFDGMNLTFMGNNLTPITQQQIINLDLGSVVRVIKSFAIGTPPSIYQNVTIEHISHQITPQAHNIVYRFAPASYATFAVTATSTCVSSQSAIGLRITGVVAEGSGQGSTGGGAEIEIIKLRSASGTGSGSENAVGLLSVSRTATGNGNGGSSTITVATQIRLATGAGVGTEIANIAITPARTGTGSGSSTQNADGSKIALVTATGSGAGNATATFVLSAIRTASGSGTGTEIAVAATVFKLDSAVSGILDTNFLD